jgi:glycopeptide antibiotics resistance protein
MMKKETIWSIMISQTIFTLLFPIWKELILYLHIVVIPVVWICITGLVFFIVFYFHKSEVYLNRQLMLWGLFIYSTGLLILLFFRPQDQQYHEYNLIPLATITYFLSGDTSILIAFYNLSANVLLFVPYGVFVSYFVTKKMWRKLIGPVIIISLIEISQMVFHRGSLDIDDLLLNVIGVYLGYLLSPMIKQVIKIKDSL